tara:strand:+ start:6008 stop:7414 length:1407 start_codon:yes stop_codon:yes gene_type:complete
MADKTLEMEVKSNVGEVAEQTEKLADSTKDAQGGFKGITKTVRGLGTALKAAGIGLIVALFAKLMDVFRQNQKVLDFFNIAMESLSIAFNDLFKFLENNIGAVTGYFKSIFENPKQSLIDFGTAIKENLIERFESLLDTFGHLGKALKHLFEGEFEDAWQSVKDAGKESIDVMTGVDNSVDKITETVTTATDAIKKYAKSTIDTATNMVELRKESELAQVQVQGLIEEYDRQAEKLRQVRDDETKTFEERIAANEELGRVLKEQEEEMLRLIDIRIREAELDLAKNDSLENQIKLQEALNEKKGVEAQITGFQSEQLTNQVSLEKEKTQLAIENADAQLQAYSDLASALSSLAGENKQLAVASAIIDTFAGANKALREGAGTPLGFIQAAAIIAAGLANVRKILSTDVGSGGGGAVPSDTGTPAPEMLSGSFTLGGTPEPQPVQAYVVTDDMTNNQNKLANIRRRATI